MEQMTRSELLTISELELLKCVRASDYRHWLDKYGADGENPFVQQAVSNYDRVSFDECRSVKSYRRYLDDFPEGKFRNDAQLKIWDIEDRKKEQSDHNDRMLENAGYIVVFALFAGVVIVPMFYGWNIGESFATAMSLVPLYYGILMLTKKKKD